MDLHPKKNLRVYSALCYKKSVLYADEKLRLPCLCDPIGMWRSLSAAAVAEPKAAEAIFGARGRSAIEKRGFGMRFLVRFPTSTSTRLKHHTCKKHAHARLWAKRGSEQPASGTLAPQYLNPCPVMEPSVTIEDATSYRTALPVVESASAAAAAATHSL